MPRTALHTIVNRLALAAAAGRAARLLLPVALGLTLLGGPGYPAPHGGGVPEAFQQTKLRPADRPNARADRNIDELAGVWKIRHIETHGQPLLTAEQLANARLTFKDGRAAVADVPLLFLRDFAFRLNPTRSPKEIDVTFVAGPIEDRTFQGIYVVRKDEARICLRLARPEMGRPKGFVTSSGDTLYTLILDRAEATSAPAAADDPITPEMRTALSRINKIHAGLDRRKIDDAVSALHREIDRCNPRVFVPLAIPHLMRLAPRDTATRVLLRKALAEGWLEEYAARACLVEAGDPPGPHVAAMLKAVGGADRKARRAALQALAGVGAAGADALAALRKIMDDAKADPADYRRAYTLLQEAPDHVLAHWAVVRIEAALKRAAATTPSR